VGGVGGATSGGAGGAAALSSLMDNRTLSRMERLRLQPNRKLTNRQQGEHLRGKGGESTEFADYRDYSAGDDTRFIDWNIFARLRRPYMKQFRMEELRHVAVFVDASASMHFEGKFDLARALALATGVMGLFAQERVYVYAWDGGE